MGRVVPDSLVSLTKNILMLFNDLRKKTSDDLTGGTFSCTEAGYLCHHLQRPKAQVAMREFLKKTCRNLELNLSN